MNENEIKRQNGQSVPVKECCEKTECDKECAQKSKKTWEEPRSGYRNDKAKELLSDCKPEIDEHINKEELQEIYKNAVLGMESVDILRPLSSDRGFRNLLLKQYRRYVAIAKEMELYAAEKGEDLNDPSLFAKGMMHFTTMINTIKDKSNSKLAEIMVQGINMGIISIMKIINRLSDEGRSNKYADKMLAVLQENLNEMKLFL